jgi:hypothetical protein
MPATLTGTGEPAGVPPLAQPEGPVSGPQAKKLTVPVGLPAAVLPVMAAESLLGSPSVTALLCGADETELGARPTVKHPPLEPSLDGA